MSPTAPNYYEVLQVSRNAEPEVLESAYRRLARKYHPDLNPEPGAAARMHQLNEAYAILSNAARRAAYDAQFSVGSSSRPAARASVTTAAPAAASVAREPERHSGARGWGKRRIAMISLVLLAGAAVVFVGYLADDATTAPPPPTSIPRSTPRPRVSVNAAPFVGKWSGHGFSLTVHRDGTAEGAWRTYEICGADTSSPCDRKEGTSIVPGGRADLKFAFTGAELADGYVLMSVDARMVGPASLKLLSYGMAELHTVDATRTLCGPHYAQEAPQNVKESSPCGL